MAVHRNLYADTRLAYVADLWAQATPDKPRAMATLDDLPRRTRLMQEIWELTGRLTASTLTVHLPRQLRANHP